MPPRKTPKNTSKARRKKSIMRLPSSLKQLMHSSIILFLVFVVVLMDLMSLWKSNDNESLFLFIFIALLTYTQNQNMIVVLGVPLIIVNVLRMMKKSLNYEGFDDEKVNPYKLQEFARDYFRNNMEYEETGTEAIVNEEDKDYSLSEIVDEFMEGPFIENEEDEENNASVMTLISRISYIDGISKEDVSDFDEEQKSQYDYVKKMIKKFKSDKKKKDDKKKKKEEEVSLEDITMEDDEIPIEGEEEEEENFDNKKKDKKKDLADITKSLQNISNMLGSSS